MLRIMGCDLFANALKSKPCVVCSLAWHHRCYPVLCMYFAVIFLGRKYVATDGSRYFWEARFTTVTFDASPSSLETIGRVIKQEEGVIRAFTVKLTSAVDRVNGKNYKNPYLAGVKNPAGEKLDWDKML